MIKKNTQGPGGRGSPRSAGMSAIGNQQEGDCRLALGGCSGQNGATAKPHR